MPLQKCNAISDQDSAQSPRGEDLHPAPVQETAHQMKHLDLVDELAGGVAQEFNNIFASILLNAQLLQDQLGNDDRRLQTLGWPRFTGSSAAITVRSTSPASRGMEPPSRSTCRFGPARARKTRGASSPARGRGGRARGDIVVDGRYTTLGIKPPERGA